ncbi:MAG: aconitate hydratase AcnA [Thermoprotei archaeon]
MTDGRSNEFIKKLPGFTDIHYVSLDSLEEKGVGKISELPYSLRIILESLARNMDGVTVTYDDVVSLANWNPEHPAEREIPFSVSRVLMQDFTGVPSVVDLAAMRDVVASNGLDPEVINPVVPVDLVTDHSVQVDYYGTPDSLRLNMGKEFERNVERYRFLKWAGKSFKNFRLFPPGLGICHQVNLEFLASCVSLENRPEGKLAFFDSVVGTDSHTTMVNGMGVVGWGVGGIEAEAAMLGQPVSFRTPEVIGVELRGALQEGVTATDLVLTVTEILRKQNVVDRFVEFFGEGLASLNVPDRATVSNMCPEYGATLALFPVDQNTLSYLELTGRSPEHIKLVEAYFRAQGMFGGAKGNVRYSRTLSINLDDVEPSISGPALPWSKLSFSDAPKTILQLAAERNKNTGTAGNGATKSVEVKVNGSSTELSDGDVVIAAITSCTNTSNPELMIAAGLLAKKAVEKGLKVPPYVKTSLAPGSRVVTDYLNRSGLLQYLEKLGFSIVGYGCTTCIGNSGPLNPQIEAAIRENKLIVASVLSGNRNFEARIHRDVRANYLMSPPLVVAYALAGTVRKDVGSMPLAEDGGRVYLRDLWPSSSEIRSIMKKAIDPEMYRQRYSNFESMVPEWSSLEAPQGSLYLWDDGNTYIQKPPFFDAFEPEAKPRPKDIEGCRPLLILGDAVTTDHISPAGAIAKDSPAGSYLTGHGVKPEDFNSYGSRRGNHHVMMRGTFTNRGVKNIMVPGTEGGYTVHYPSGEKMTVFDAAQRYLKEGVPLVIIAGSEYGTGSSRDWAAKGPKLLGVRAVVAKSFERIHRTNLVGMGILPLEFPAGVDATTLHLVGTEKYTISGLSKGVTPRQTLKLLVERADGQKTEVDVRCRLDTEVEVQYYLNGGILDYVLRKMIAEKHGSRN